VPSAPPTKAILVLPCGAEVANGGNCSTDVVGGCEARARADYVRVYGESRAGRMAGSGRIELAVHIWLRKAESEMTPAASWRWQIST